MSLFYRRAHKDIVSGFRRPRAGDRGLIAAPWTPLASLCSREGGAAGRPIVVRRSMAVGPEDRAEENHREPLTTHRLS